eukprot:scaffold155684_cov18-Prasinocladus_malaysianus.AAC.1
MNWSPLPYPLYLLDKSRCPTKEFTYHQVAQPAYDSACPARQHRASRLPTDNETGRGAQSIHHSQRYQIVIAKSQRQATL